MKFSIRESASIHKVVEVNQFLFKQLSNRKQHFKDSVLLYQTADSIAIVIILNCRKKKTKNPISFFFLNIV